MIYHPSKEYLFTKILWLAFFPVFWTAVVYNFWNPAGWNQNPFLITSSLFLSCLFINAVLALAKIYQRKLYLDQEAVEVIDGVNIKWDEIITIGVWQRSWFIFLFTTLVIKSKTKELVYCLSFLSEADRQKLKKELTAKLGPNGIYPAFD